MLAELRPRERKAPARHVQQTPRAGALAPSPVLSSPLSLDPLNDVFSRMPFLFSLTVPQAGVPVLRQCSGTRL